MVLHQMPLRIPLLFSSCKKPSQTRTQTPVCGAMKAHGLFKMRTRLHLVMGLALYQGTSSLAGQPLACRVEKLLPHYAGVNEEPMPR